jgi:hypothetical protein
MDSVNAELESTRPIAAAVDMLANADEWKGA